MSAQLGLPLPGQLLSESPIAASHDPWTSHAAARAVTKDGSRARQQNIVLGAIKQFPGCTTAELARHLKTDRWTVARRAPELREAELVVNGEARRCVVTGKQSLTWWVAGSAKEKSPA